MKKRDDFRAKGLFLSGFQSIVEPTYIPLKPLTLLYGPNSAGKSSIIDAIELFENIAHRQWDQIWAKVTRWQYRGIDDRGAWQYLGAPPYKNASSAYIRIGVEFVVPADWAEHVDQEVKESQNDFGGQPHLESLAKLVGRTVHIDFGIVSPWFPFGIRVAIDGKPLLECRIGEFDDGDSCRKDSLFRREGDEGFDQIDSNEECQVDYGPMRLYVDHEFWKKFGRIERLAKFSSTNEEVAIAAFVRTQGECVTLYDVDFNRRDSDSGSSSLYKFEIGFDHDEAFRRTGSGEMAQAKKSAGKGAVQGGARNWAVSDLEEILDELGLICNALLQLGAASLGRVHVKGNRQVLAPSDTTFRMRNRDVMDVDNSLGACYARLAQSLSVEETNSRKLHNALRSAEWFEHKKDHRIVNQWLLSTLPSLRGYKLRADAHMTTQLTKKRESFGAIENFVFRLYLVDAQGRPHEFEDVGSGFSYLFPILVALWAGQWSIIEQPELHLHPAAQCDVADAFIAAKNLGHAALVESHSENLILRILRRIRETTEGRAKAKSLQVTPDDLAVLYFDPQLDGTTKVKQLRISRDGDFIDRWPAGFFEERSKELFGE